MTIDFRDLKNKIISPTLKYLSPVRHGIYNRSAVELLLGTIAVESTYRGDTNLQQLRGGPALGIYQIEYGTCKDVHTHYINFRKDVLERINHLLAPWPDRKLQLITNLAYATAIARLIYYRNPIHLAAPGDIAGHAKVWKTVYNTYLGKGTEIKFIEAWEEYVKPDIQNGDNA